MKITDIKYDAGTISAPAFLDLWLEDGKHVTFKGKAAKRRATTYKVGDLFTEEQA